MDKEYIETLYRNFFEKLKNDVEFRKVVTKKLSFFLLAVAVINLFLGLGYFIFFALIGIALNENFSGILASWLESSKMTKDQIVGALVIIAFGSIFWNPKSDFGEFGEDERDELVKQSIKDYLGPCEGDECRTQVVVADAFLSEHLAYSRGDLDWLILGDSGSKYSSIGFDRSSERLEATYFAADGERTLYVDYDVDKVRDIYYDTFERFGPEMFEKFRGEGKKAFRDAIANYARPLVDEKFKQLYDEDAEEWKNY